jgi:ribosomal protein S18 acetylase RimI-like enzyme
VVAVAPDGTVASFGIVWFDDVNSVGQFEPVGTHEAFRRLGLARAVMARGLEVMARRGMTSAKVEYDATNAPAHALYTGLGFAKKYETWGFRRQVTRS